MSKTLKPLRRAVQLRSLEQRFMFDGAAGHEVVHAAQAAAALAAVPAAVEVRAAEPARDQGRKEVTLVDTSVAGYKQLEAGIGAGVGIVEFDGSRDGLAQIAQWAAAQSGYDAIHLLSHGSEARLDLGTALIDDQSLQAEPVRQELAALGGALKSDGDLLIYGCDVGAGTGGQRLLDDLASATSADVAASTDATGAAAQGGNWTLERHSGDVRAQALHLDGYDGLLGTVSFSSGDADLQYSQTSVTRTDSSRTFTFSGGNGFGGLGVDGTYGSDGLYAYEGTAGGNDIKLTISIQSGYTFDITSFNVGVQTGSLKIDLTYGDNTTASFTQNGLANSWQTLSSFSTAINDVKQVVLTSNQFGLFQNFVFADVKAYPAIPTVTDARIAISGASGTGGAYRIGDTVTATWNNTASGDGNLGVTGVTMDFSQFGGGSAVAATNSSGTWTATYTITAGAIDATNRNVSVTATSSAGSTTTADSTNATVDSVAPTVTDARVSISGASGTGGAFKIGDTVTATWNNTAGGDNNTDPISAVTMDFSQFDGGSAVAATNSAGTWTATYTITAGTIDLTSRNVSVTATDNAGNNTTTADTTNATVDNIAPTVTDANLSLSGASGTGGAFKIGDTVTATWNNTAGGDNNADPLAAVTVDFSAFGGGSAVAATNSAGTWTATYTIVAGALDATNRNISVTATDNAGNTKTTADTTNATVDNIAPTVTDGNLSLSGGTGTGGAFKIGDTVTATWNNTAGGDNNPDTISGVTVDFSAFGGGSAVAATNSAGTWTATYTITAGAIDGTNKNVSVTATDNAGNTTTTADTTNATVDSLAPTVTDGNLSLSGATGTGGAFKIGDTVTATWNNTAGGDNNSDTISGVTVDFSAFGGGSAVAATNSSGTWTATTTITAGAIDGTNKNVSVTATDNAGNTKTTADTTNATVDNIAPTVTDANLSLSGATGIGGAFRIGDTVTATWDNTAAGDNNADTLAAVTVDFSQFGGGSAVAATNSAGTWTATYTIVAGALDATNRNISLTATDNAGNSTTTADSSSATVNNVALVVTDANISLSGATGTGGAFKIGDTVTATWNNTAAGDNNPSALVGVTVDFSQFGGSSAVAATNSAGTWTATYTLVAGGLEAANRNVSVTATDTAGNTATTADSTNATVDSLPPAPPSMPVLSSASDTGASNSDNYTSNTTPELTGTADANTTVLLYDSDGVTLLGSTTSDGSGNWAITSATLADGPHALIARAQDAAGNLSLPSAPLPVAIDTGAPAAPSTPDLATGSDSGTSSSDDVTRINTPTFTGTAESGSLVTLYDSDGSTVLGSATATGGNWSITTSTLADGSHTVTARATDAAGNTSAASSGLSVDIDTGAPTALALDTTTVTVSAASANASIATLSASDGLAITYALATGNGTNDADNASFSITGNSLKVGASALAAGSYHLYVSATDAAGNVANQAFTLTVNDIPGVSGIVRADTALVPAGTTAIAYTVSFDQAVTGVDASDFTLTATGNASGHIASVSGSGTTYTVSVDTLGGDGTLRLDLNASGTGIQNGSAVAIAGGYTAGEAYTVDRVAPALPSAPVLAAASDSGLSASDGITNRTTPTFTGTAEAGSTVTLYDSDGTTVLGSTTATGGSWSITASTLAVGSHTVTARASDAAGNVSGASAGLAVSIDTTAPAVSQATGPATGAYKAGDVLTFSVATSETVSVSGTPQLAFSIGGSARVASYLSGSGSGSLVFAYTVQAGDNGALALSALQANGATLTDTAGNALDLALQGVADLSGRSVDTQAPAVTSVAVPAAGSYGAQQTLDFDVHFSEDVVVDTAGGTPRLALDIGGSTAYASYLSGSGGNTLHFRYTVAGGLLDADGIAVGALQANGAQLHDAAGNTAALALNAVGSTGVVLVDSVAPQVTGLGATTADGSYKDGSVVLITVGFDRAVQVSGTPTLALNSGGHADYVSGSGSSTLSFRYVVQPGDNAADLDAASDQALTLGSSGGIVSAGATHQAAQLTLPAPGAGGSLGAARALVIDTTAPAISFADLALSTDSGSSASDFITNVAAQTLTARLSAAPAAGERVYASLDGGATWTDVTARLSGTTLSWSGITLAGSNSFQLKVTDAAGNDSTVKTQAFVLDTTAPDKPAISPNSTTEQRPTLSGSATLAAGEALTVSVGGATYAVTPAAGQWALNLATATPLSGSLSLVPGQDYTVTATAGDAAGNTSSATGTLSVLQVPTPLPPAPPPPAPEPVIVPPSPPLPSAAPGPVPLTFLPSASPVMLAIAPVNGMPVDVPRSSEPSLAAPSSTALPQTTSGTGFQIVVRSDNGSEAGAPALLVNRPMADQAVSAANGRTEITVPADTFATTGSPFVQLSAVLVNGAPLPSWISFDPRTGKFIAQPPAGLKTDVSIRLIARDAQGHQAVMVFKLQVNAQPAGRSSLSEQLGARPVAQGLDAALQRLAQAHRPWSSG